MGNPIPKSCQNYDPNERRATGVEGIYVCRNHRIAEERFPDMVNVKPNACLFCYNWQTPEGNYKNRGGQLLLPS